MRAASEGLVERTVVTELRVSTTATRIHDRLEEIGGPNRFIELHQHPESVRGVDLERPFFGPFKPAEKIPVDTRFWSMIANDKALSDSVNESLAKTFRHVGVPLRHKVRRFDVPDVENARMEVHVLPYGFVGIATLELRWEEPIPLADAWEEVNQRGAQEAKVEVVGSESSTTAWEAAGVAADRLVDLFAEARGNGWSLDDYRITTVIDGFVEPIPQAMPTGTSALRSALHYLSRGTPPLADPKEAFVPLWSHAGFQWDPTCLIYMLDRGLTAWSGRPPGLPPGMPMGDRHRHFTLLLAHLTASVGLVTANSEIPSPNFQQWAPEAADRLARLYGPAKGHYGLETRRYLDQTGARTLVEAARGTELVRSFPFPDW